MKKSLIGSLVLFGLMAVTCFSGNVKGDDKEILKAIKEVKEDIQSVKADVEKLKSKSSKTKHRSHGDSDVDFSARINKTLSDHYKERQKAKEERELAEALQCLLSKANTQPCGCSNAAPACQYVKPACAPLQCAPAPCAVWQR